MDVSTIILLTYFIFILPIISTMLLIMYDGMFQINNSLLTKMVEALSVEDREIAYHVRSKIVRNFRLFAFTVIVWINMAFVSLYSAIYILEIDDPSLLLQVIQYSAIIVLIPYVNLLRHLKGGLEFQQWTAVLEHHGLSLEQVHSSPALSSYGKPERKRILIRSWFRTEYPNISVYGIPPAEHRIFSFTKNVSKEPESVFRKNENKEYEAGFTNINDFTRDLKTSKLWIKDYNYPLLVSGIGISVVSFSLFTIMIYEIPLNWLPLEYTTYNYILVVIILIISISLITIHVRMNEMYNLRTAKKILDNHHVIYTEETILKEIITLIEKHYPYTDISTFKA